MNTIQLLKDLVYKEYKQNNNINFNCVRMGIGVTDNRPFFHYEDTHNNMYYNLYAGFEPVLKYIAAKIDNIKVDVLENEKLIADRIYEDIMCLYNEYREENYYILDNYIKSCYEGYIESIVNEIQAELKLNKKDIIFDNKYIIMLFNGYPVVKNNDYKKTPAYLLYSVLKLFLTDDNPIKAIDKLNKPDRTKDLLKATIKYIKSKYDIANKYFD